MNTLEKILDNFPKGMTPREIQVSIFKEIAKAIDGGFKYILLDAGTGIGKSAIAMTLANFYESAYVVTVTKQLQDQYSDDHHITAIKGRGNFSCKSQTFFGRTFNCDDGYCQVATDKNYKCDYGVSKKGEGEIAFQDQMGEDWVYNTRGGKCNYWDQKVEAINDSVTLMNYSSFFPELNYIPFFGKRELGIFDEVHNLEDQVMKQISLTISNDKIVKDYGQFLELEDELHLDLDDPMYVPPVIPAVGFKKPLPYWLEQIKELSVRYEVITRVEGMPKKVKRTFENMVQKLDTIIEELGNYPDEWILDADVSNQKITFKPIDVRRFCKKYFFDHVDVSLLMSATVLNKDKFCEWHGIDPKEVYYIYAKSPFDKELRPIYLKPVGKMSYRFKDQTKPRTLPVIREILANHPNEKGVIHTNSHEFARYINDYLRDSRIICYSGDGKSFKNRPNRDETISEFMDSDRPLVLVAPSVDEGVDFAGDLCTFQIIYKIPFPSLGDKQIKARMEKDKDWYAYKTVTSLVQAYGRGMRKHDDHCDTYILDADIEGVLKDKWRRCVYFLPEYFLEAIRDEKKKNLDAFMG